MGHMTVVPDLVNNKNMDKNADIVLEDYGFSKHLGFIMENPLDKLPPYFDPWVELVRAGFERDVFPPQAAKWCRIVATRLHADAGLVGAAMIASDSVG